MSKQDKAKFLEGMPLSNKLNVVAGSLHDLANEATDREYKAQLLDFFEAVSDAADLIWRMALIAAKLDQK